MRPHRLAMPLVLWLATPALAGMPVAPSLTDWARARLETISFFVVVLLLSAAAVMGIWNSIRKDVPRLPRLSYAKALGLVVLWGLLFCVVLGMITGARGLLTPGAWKRDGATYRLADPPTTTQPTTREGRR
jgi:hypothetical protein